MKTNFAVFSKSRRRLWASATGDRGCRNCRMVMSAGPLPKHERHKKHSPATQDQRHIQAHNTSTFGHIRAHSANSCTSKPAKHGAGVAHSLQPKTLSILCTVLFAPDCAVMPLRSTDRATDPPTDRPTDRPTDLPTDRPTDRPADRHHVAVLAEAHSCS